MASNKKTGKKISRKDQLAERKARELDPLYNAQKTPEGRTLFYAKWIDYDKIKSLTPEEREEEISKLLKGKPKAPEDISLPLDAFGKHYPSKEKLIAYRKEKLLKFDPLDPDLSDNQ